MKARAPAVVKPDAAARGTRSRDGIVSETAVGTPGRLALQPSFSRWRRQGSSSPTTRTSDGSWKSQTGGSMNASGPFSQVPGSIGDSRWSRFA